MEIRGLSISYSSYKKKEQEKIEVSLINDITALESQEQINLELINAKTLNLENLRKQKLQGHFVRSRKTNKIFSEFGVSKLFEQNYQKSRTGSKGNYL